MKKVILKKGRDKSVRNHHPWLFSGAISKVEINPAPGEIVQICDYRGNGLAAGYYNSRPQIQVRILDWDSDAEIDKKWWHTKIACSINRRAKLNNDGRTNAFRLIYSESDGLPGLIIDKYAEYLVLQSLTAGIERIKEDIVNILVDLVHPKCIYDRSDGELRGLEGLNDSTGLLCGEKPASGIIILENNLKYEVDIISGQKTGFYLDQRENHLKVAEYARGLNVLDCFSHTGAFAICALQNGAESVTLVDSSENCLKMAERDIGLNNLRLGKAEFIKGDAFEILRQFRDRGRKFDMIVLDPPKFAKSQSHLKQALAGYKDINMLGMAALNRGGFLATFSCSGAVDNETLKTILFWAAVDTNKRVQILHDLYQAPDHPRLATFPEASYLKGYICRIE